MTKQNKVAAFFLEHCVVCLFVAVENGQVCASGNAIKPSKL